MDETAQASRSWLPYILIPIGIVVFGASLVLGYLLGGQDRERHLEQTGSDGDVQVVSGYQEIKAQGDYDPPEVTPTIGTPRSVRVAVDSEIERVVIVDAVDEAVLGEWWQTLNVDAQALPMKELGSYNWRTPERIRIVFRDINPLSYEQRWKLYKPTASSPDVDPVSGLTTMWSDDAPDTLEYVSYYDPEVLIGDWSSSDIGEAVNRRIFEILYEGAVGSTAISQERYDVAVEQVFGEDEWRGVVEVSVGEGQSRVDDKNSKKDEILSVAGTLQDDVWREILSVVDSLQDDIKEVLVGQVYAQTCGGDWKCGGNWEDCRCSNNGNTCLESQDGLPCPNFGGTCNCNTICVQETGALNSCNVAYGVCGAGISCSQCVARNTCAWSGPTPTTAASCGNGTCGSGESCSNCPADCGECTEVTWAYITVTVYGDNGLQAPSNRTQEPGSGNNTCKGYGFASSSTGTSWNANGNCQNTWLLDMDKANKSMNISNCV